MLDQRAGYGRADEKADAECNADQSEGAGSLVGGAVIGNIGLRNRQVSSGRTVDNAGDMYRGTVLGIEMESASGRMDMILNPPKYGGVVSHVAFGGADRDWLYASEDGKLYRRQTKRKGSAAWELVKPPQPSL